MGHDDSASVHHQVPTLPPATTGPPVTGTPAPAGTLTVQMTLDPNPAVAGGNVTVEGEAVWSTGTAPQGTVQILVCTSTLMPHACHSLHCRLAQAAWSTCMGQGSLPCKGWRLACTAAQSGSMAADSRDDTWHVLPCQVDGAVVGTAPLVPPQLLQGWAWQGGAGRHLLQPSFSPGTSLFFFQLVAPTTPGAHNVTAVATVSGTAYPVTAYGVSEGSALASNCTGMPGLEPDSWPVQTPSSSCSRMSPHGTALLPCRSPP